MSQVRNQDKPENARGEYHKVKINPWSMTKDSEKQFMETEKCVDCNKKIDMLNQHISQVEQRLEFAMLKIQEILRLSSLEATKHLETFSKIIDMQKLLQELNYKIWQERQTHKKYQLDFETVHMKFIEFKQSTKVSLDTILSRVNNYYINLQQIMNKGTQSNIQRLKCMYEALEDFGYLQSNLQKEMQDVKLQVRQYIQQKLNTNKTTVPKRRQKIK